MRKTTLAGLALSAASFLFGSTFVVIKDAVVSYPPIAFVGWRFLIGGVALSLLVRPRDRSTWRHGAIAGFFLFSGYCFQTVGLVTTGASNSALITGLFVVVTPLLAAVLDRRWPASWVMTSAALAFLGVALLTWNDSTMLNSGDILTVGAAVSFAAHIIALARFAQHHSVIPFTSVQLLVTAALAIPLSVVVEGFTPPTRQVLPAMLVTALGVSAGAFLLQIWAQTVVGPSRTAILLTLEPTFAVLTAAVVLGERFTTAGWVGAGLILAAIYAVIVTSPETATIDAEAISEAH
jgi:drug/metabolite transporter (DMT)-like permease